MAGLQCKADSGSPSRLREGLGEGVFIASPVTGPPPSPPASGRGEFGATAARRFGL